MDRSFETALEKVMKLDAESQVTIAETILAKVSGSEEHDDAWREEIRNRVEAYDRGEIEAGDASEMFARVRKMIADARRAA